jgi:signal transduction histidine kinase
MIYKSVKFQLAMIAFLFVVFVAIVLVQLHYTMNMQAELLSRQQRTHSVIAEYLIIEEQERRILGVFESFLQEEAAIPDIEILSLDGEIGRWFESLSNWKRNLDRWKRDGSMHHSLKHTVFSPAFIKDKERQVESYRRILSLCREGKSDEGRSVLRIEEANLPQVRESVDAILQSVAARFKEDIELSRDFSRGTALSILLALVAILFVASVIALRLTYSLRKLEEGAARISNGDFTSRIEIRGPSELTRLARTFNAMQDAIRARDETIRDDAREIQKLNAILEQKVEERNRTILNQNISLKRKNEELEQILYAASHDLRTPLISIQGFSEELKTACASLRETIGSNADDGKEIGRIVTEEIDASLDYIINGSKRMEVLLEGLLRLSRMGRESLKIQKVDMKVLIRNVADTLSFQMNEAGAELKIDDLCPCNGDPSQLEQVFFNLLSNAIKYRHKNRKCVVRIRSEKVEGFSRFIVEDNGIGIPAENLDRIFHAFYRVDDENGKGEGIGLAIVNRAVDLHNGRVWVESQLDTGSQFILEIPDNEF